MLPILDDVIFLQSTYILIITKTHSFKNGYSVKCFVDTF